MQATQKLQSVQNSKAHGVHSLPPACCCKCVQTKLLLLHMILPCFSSAVLTHPSVVSLQGFTRQPESRSSPHGVSCINKGRKPNLCHVDQHLPAPSLDVPDKTGWCTRIANQVASDCGGHQHQMHWIPVTGLSTRSGMLFFIMFLDRSDVRYTFPRIHLLNILRM